MLNVEAFVYLMGIFLIQVCENTILYLLLKLFYVENTLDGCWNDNVKQISVQVGRCGCNASSQLQKLPFMLPLVNILILFYFLL